ncbi:MAG: 5'-methylthioadenosine/S-adenosylhomocysteine nucleosidase [Chloroflexi bacterium]|nr:5'-methylthioadenosine/S-adenosylhomocysteine nucleosidase [Chloroflexota bacterium]
MERPICIMAALENELREVLSHLTIERVERYGMSKFYRGSLDGRPVVAVETNWGVVPATMAAMSAVMHFQPSAILVTGISGALAEGMNRGDVVIVDATCNHNFEMFSTAGRHPLPIPYYDQLGRWQALRRVASDPRLVELALQAARAKGLPLASEVIDQQAQPGSRKVWIGASAAGEVMAFERQERKRLAQAYEAIAVDMETIGEAHVALTFGIPYLAIRQISDDIFDEMAYEETRWPALTDQTNLHYTADELAQIAAGSPQTWQSQTAVVFDHQTSWAVTAAHLVLEVARLWSPR